jgi:hypothetical protein
MSPHSFTFHHPPLIAPFLLLQTWWSFFGHGDNYGFVPHGDTFTLHYPGQGAEHAQLVLALRAHAYKMRGVAPPTRCSRPDRHKLLRFSILDQLRPPAANFLSFLPDRWPEPGAPLITAVVQNANGTTTLAWRGGILAVNYTVQHGPSETGTWRPSGTLLVHWI